MNDTSHVVGKFARNKKDKAKAKGQAREVVDNHAMKSFREDTQICHCLASCRTSLCINFWIVS
jgi:hypothetical protein